MGLLPPHVIHTCIETEVDLLLLHFLQGHQLSVDDVTNELQEIIKDVLGIVVSPQQPLMEVGLSSLSALELRNAISTRFAYQELSTTFVFDYPTIDAMSQHLQIDKSLNASHKIMHTITKGETFDMSLSTEVIAVSCRYPKDVLGAGF